MSFNFSSDSFLLSFIKGSLSVTELKFKKQYKLVLLDRWFEKRGL